MNQEARKIKSFTDLNVWREGHKLVLLIYKITAKFPKEEIFGLEIIAKPSFVIPAGFD
jgi:hypothetical protein